MSTTTPSFPYTKYTSILGAHSLLLLFTALYVPRTSLLIATLPAQATSQDKPQHAFLHPLTADPILTLAWLCLGVVICQVWWAGWMRLWWKEYEMEQFARFGVEKSDVERRIESIETVTVKLNVCCSSYRSSLVFINSTSAARIRKILLL